MAIQYGPGYDPNDQPTPGGPGFQTVNSWNDLLALEPAPEGKEILLSQGIVGSPVAGSVLVRRYADAWNVPGCDALGLAYLSSHPIPQTALTVAGPWVIDGGIPDVYGSPSIGDFMGNWGYSTVTSATTSRAVYNTTGAAVTRVKFGVMTSSTDTANVSLKVKIGDNFKSPDGPWIHATFNNQSFTKPVGSEAGAVIVWTDWINLPTAINAGEAVSVWSSASGGSDKALPLSGGFNYAQWLETTRSLASWISPGNGVADETMSWIVPMGATIGVSKIAWGYADTSKSVVNIVAFGDSTFAMFDGWNQPDDFTANGYQGWTYHATKLAQATGQKYAVTSLGRGAMDIHQYGDIALAAIPGLVGVADVIAFQPWSGNSPTTAASKSDHLQVTAQIKAACDSAGISFMPLMISLPGDGVWDGTVYDGGSMTPENIQLYQEVKDYMSITYPSYLDVSDVMRDASGNHYLRNDSPDDNHCYTSNATEQRGQWKTGNALNARIIPKLQSLGYPV